MLCGASYVSLFKNIIVSQMSLMNWQEIIYLLLCVKGDKLLNFINIHFNLSIMLDIQIENQLSQKTYQIIILLVHYF